MSSCSMKARQLRTKGRELRRWPTKGSGIVSATIWTRLKGHDFVHVAVTGAPALQLHHLLEFESLYGELICQAFEKGAPLRVAGSPAHKGQIRGIGTEFVQFFPEVRHGIGPVLDPPRHVVTGCRSTGTGYGFFLNRLLGRHSLGPICQRSPASFAERGSAAISLNPSVRTWSRAAWSGCIANRIPTLAH